MNIPTEPTVSALSDFVFRAADRMRIDGCANAIAREGMSLALHCEHEALLDHYVSLLLGRLRQQLPSASIEVYFPANTDSLLSRFNEVLAQQSVKQAVKGPTAASQAQIWLVHDAQNLPDAEVQLLARLIQNFPGANIRAILMMTGTPGKAPLSAFGRKILRWDIEAPGEEHIQSALDMARSDGRLQAVSQLVRQIQRRGWAGMDAPVAPAAIAAMPAPTPTQPAAGLPGRLAQFQAQGQQTTRQWLDSLKNIRLPRGKNAPLIAGLVFALLASILLMMWLQPEAFGIGPKNNTVPRPALTAPTEVSPAPMAPASAPMAAAPTSALAAPPAPAMPSASLAAKAALTEAPDPAMQAQKWVRSLDPLSFLLQHGTTNTYENAVALRNKYAGLSQAEIVAAYRPGEGLAHFVIVSGPYSQVGQGYDAAKRRDIPGNTWVRSTRTLQDQLKAP
ncbi:MAG: hypothetical protein KAY21_01410 [Limnohabitans sp.]|nr:hypothetical protein [Limnohabitans sp.]